MPRNARIDLPGCLYHVMARGNERRKIFVDDEDYEEFVSRFRKALDKTGNRCLAWCLMPNHVHLLILRGERPLSELMRLVMTGYVAWFNRRQRRNGHLFQNRYKALLCEAEEYLLELVAYIHLNPLRANLVKGIAGLSRYRWSGHGEILGTRSAGIVRRGYVLEHFCEREKEAVEKYAAFMAEREFLYKGGELSGGGLVRSQGGMNNVLALRRSGDRELGDERVLGGGEFVEEVLRKAGLATGKKRSAAEIMEDVERATSVSA